MNIIINADDLGANESIDGEIFALAQKEKITSSTMIANGLSIKEAARQSRSFPACSFGIHLNLTAFSPLTTSSYLQPILNSRDEFYGLEKILSVRWSYFFFKAVYEEFCAQVDRLYSYGVDISHIDTHQHIHNIPYIFIIVKMVQKRYQIRKMRITKNLYVTGHCNPIVLLIKKSIYNFFLRNFYKTITTSFFTDFLSFFNLPVKFYLTGKSVELMVHPGMSGSEHETQVLCSNWQEGVPVEVKMINYNQL